MNKGYICISNKGEIDINAFRLLGASDKRGDNGKIGFFGSGLKYAIALLLREKVEVKIFSGDKEVKVSTVKDKFRGIPVEVITVNGRRTSLTTDAGPKWKSWFAIREIYSNAIDEGGCTMTISDSPKPIKGRTVFYIQNHEVFKELFSNWNDYFSDKRTDVIQEITELPYPVTLYMGHEKKTIMYRRGIRCFDSTEPSLFHYEIQNAEINESRILEDMYTWGHAITDTLSLYANEQTIRYLFDNYTNKNDVDYMYWGYNRYSDEWLKAIDGRTLIPKNFSGNFLELMSKKQHIILPDDLVKSLSNYFKEKVKVAGNYGETKKGGVDLKFNVKQATVVKSALQFLNDVGEECNYEIRLHEFENKRALGSVSDDKILISPRAFEKGAREVIMTILEEKYHLETEYGDQSRELQHYLFEKVMTLLLEKKGNMIL